MRGSSHQRRARLFGLASVVALATAGFGVASVLPASAASAVTVSVNAGQSRAPFDAAAVGTNVSVYDGNMNDGNIAGLLKNGGFGAVRYPGGSYADIYHWQTNTADGGFVAPNTDFDTFMGTLRAAGAQPVITTDYGSGTPQEAAAWVRYANVTKGYGVKYWEVGNEVYGNGEYSNGSGWETDKHSSHSATTYANNLVQYIAAMKAVDPSIKVGAVLTTPGNWPDGLVGPGDTKDWNHTVLSIAGSKIDFAIVHWYPGGTSEADMLAKPAQIPAMMNTVHSLLNQYAGSNAAHVGVAVTEVNGNVYRDTMPGALFAADDYLGWMENGAFNVDWWALHNGTDCSQVTTVSGAEDDNDYGVLSSGASCEPALDTPFAPYYGTAMVSKLGGGGDTLIAASSSSALLSAHAVRRANGDVSVMLINKDPNNDAVVNLTYGGFSPAAGTTVYTYRKNGTSITSGSGTSGSQTVPAYSLAVVQLHAGTGGPTTTPTTTPPSTGPPSPTPTGGGTVSCRVTYTKNEWQGGLTANVTVSNTGASAVNGWSLRFAFPGDTRLTNAWNATASQTGNTVTATNLSYNASIPPNGSVQFGFQGTWAGNDANPTSFALNGATCASG